MIKESLQTTKVTPALVTCLIGWLNEMSETGSGFKYTFRSLEYLENLLRQICRLDLHSEKIEDLLVTMLCRSNFNHLAFLNYRQDILHEKLSGFSSEGRLQYLQKQKAAIASCPEVKNLVYDVSWPSIKTMLVDWLEAEIALAQIEFISENEVRAQLNIPKLPLDLSVAHLACLIRSFFEEGIFATQNLKLIFKSFAGHYQTKRQSAISPGSLSKEFYSIDQHTAARVRELLQKMVQRINRDFFPVLVAISIIILPY